MAAYTFLDPLYLEWYKKGQYDRSGIFALTTDLGQSHWMLAGAGSIILFMTTYRFPKSVFHAIHWHHIFLKFYFAFTTISFSGLLVLLFKNGIGRARPKFYEGYDIWYSSPFGDAYTFASFPSGHSTTAGAAAMIIVLLLPRYSLLAVLFALWVGVSRMMVGAHFPSDVVAGLALGAGFAWIYARSFARKRLLFEFGAKGHLQMRDLSAKRARKKMQKTQQPLSAWGFSNSRTMLNK